MNRRISSDRRLHDMLVKEERRKLMRRSLEDFRRTKTERRVEEKPITEERRQELRRKEDIDKLQKDNPEYNLPIEP